MAWLFPLPLQMIPSETGVYPANQTTWLPIGNHPGAFGTVRKHHQHEGVDLYALPETPVYAVEAGTVVHMEWFTGEQATPPSPWWKETQAVFVEGESGVVVYGEITPAPHLTLGQSISQGDLIGWVTEVLKQDKNRPTCMLHLELYEKGQRESLIWDVDAPQPASLCDPTPYLQISKAHPSWKSSFYTKPLQMYQSLLPSDSDIPTVCEWMKHNPFERLFLDLDGRRFFDLMLQYEEDHWPLFWETLIQQPGACLWISELIRAPKIYSLIHHPNAILGLVNTSKPSFLSDTLNRMKISDIHFLNQVLQHKKHLPFETWQSYWELLFKWDLPLLHIYPISQYTVKCPYIYQYFLMPHHFLQDLPDEHLLFLQTLSKKHGKPWSTELLMASEFYSAPQQKNLAGLPWHALPWNYSKIDKFKAIETEYYLNQQLIDVDSGVSSGKEKKRL